MTRSTQHGALDLPERPELVTPTASHAQPFKMAVVVASANRPEILAQVIESCQAQRDVVFEGVVSVPDDASLPDPGCRGDWKVVVGVRGAAAQRNAGVAVLDAPELIAFFDDDSVLRPDYLVNAMSFFARHPDVLALTGRVVLDGARSGEISPDVAAATLLRSTAEPQSGAWRPTRELYGCNFVVRADAAPDIAFDERLPLYSWLEDHDLARRLSRFGLLAHVDDCVAVHRAAASGGRAAHLKFGYSQVMNPLYLLLKGSFDIRVTARQLLRPVSKNALRSIGGGERAWRRGRLRGNLMALGDAVRGRITPERITEL